MHLVTMPPLSTDVRFTNPDRCLQTSLFDHRSVKKQLHLSTANMMLVVCLLQKQRRNPAVKAQTQIQGSHRRRSRTSRAMTRPEVRCCSIKSPTSLQAAAVMRVGQASLWWKSLCGAMSSAQQRPEAQLLWKTSVLRLQRKVCVIHCQARQSWWWVCV